MRCGWAGLRAWGAPQSHGSDARSSGSRGGFSRGSMATPALGGPLLSAPGQGHQEQTLGGAGTLAWPEE